MSYTEEFRREAVQLYRTGDQGLDITEHERLRQAEKELKQLREENEILIKVSFVSRRSSSLRRRQKRR